MSKRQPPSDNLKVHRIFVVDDHPAVRRVLARLLGSEVDLMPCGEAASAEEALEKIPGCAPDLILTDIMLPGMDGIYLAEQLKLIQPGLPVVLMSGYPPDVYGERGRNAGARGYIRKGDGDGIAEVIRQVLGS